MAVLNIKRIKAIHGAGVFEGYTVPAAVPDFAKFNLIYGFNGCGKTTLSRNFFGLSVPAVEGQELPGSSSMKVELSDGTVVDRDTVSIALKRQIFVFNTDFVDSNLSWSQGTAEPVFYLGAEQVEIAAQIEQLENELNEVSWEVGFFSTQRSNADKIFSKFKTDVARDIAREIYRGRNYTAANLSADYLDKHYDDEQVIPDEDRQPLRDLIAADAPLAKRIVHPPEPIDFIALFGSSAVLGATVGDISIATLRDHPGMFNWVATGLVYHRDQHLEECLFCGSDLPEARLMALGEAVGESWSAHLNRIAAATESVESALEALQWSGVLPEAGGIAPAIRNSYSRGLDALNAASSAAFRAVEPLRRALAEKSASPAEAVHFEWDIAEVIRLQTAYQETTAYILQLIDAHNAEHDEFEASQRRAIETLKSSHLAAAQVRYIELGAAVATPAAKLDEVDGIEREKRAELESLRARIRTHNAACEPINNLIRSYLGHDELSIKALEEGYEICRFGERAYRLSEGEKTAISLCYFLCILNSDGRDVGESIIVFDDPISSLDTKALNYAFALLRATGSKAKQVFIFTHNVHFMNEAKKWIKLKKDKGALFVLECTKSGAARKSLIKPMPDTLKRYDSEYHYLFQVIWNFHNGAAGSIHEYIIPNLLRKLLETYLAFKLPTSDGVAVKLNKVIENWPTEDAAHIQGLNRLIQVESHGDSLEDLHTLPSMTLEEIRSATAAVFGLMQGLDQDHYGTMLIECAA